jgi:NAD(P)-dependent dehydrogenase (short-subunit alcohol dehydrogenase family)
VLAVLCQASLQFKAMTDKEWDDIHEVHVKGAYHVTHAAWPIMRKQKYGRIINVRPGRLV